LFLKPTTFAEQKGSFEKLESLLEDQRIGLIIVDSITLLYRLEIGKTDKVYSVNKELGRQLSLLSRISRKNKIPIIAINQVYSDFEGKINMVGGDLLRYQSKCLIELVNKTDGYKEAILRKHRSIKENKKVKFKILQEGITPL